VNVGKQNLFAEILAEALPAAVQLCTATTERKRLQYGVKISG